MRPQETRGDDDDDKLIPEWGARGDDQIIWIGLAVFAAMLLVFGGSRLFGGDDSPLSDIPGVAAISGTDSGNGAGTVAAAGAAAAPVIEAAEAEAGAGDEEAATSTTAPTTTVATTTVVEVTGPDLGALQAATAGLPGTVNPSLDGTTAVLTGFVADAAEESAAIDAAAAVEGVEGVTSELVLLEPEVASVLTDRGVVGGGAEGVGTEITVTGTLQSEADRAPALEAAAAVPGVTNIIDGLDVSVAEALNELPTIPFATGSSTILAEGQSIVDEAAAILTGAGDVSFEVQGWTDITGDDAINLALSDARAAAVVEALVAAGVDADRLTPIGYGETEQFGAGTSAEALAANRVVRFVQTG